MASPGFNRLDSSNSLTKARSSLYMGFNDTEVDPFTGIELTSTSQKKFEMGAMGARILFENIENTSAGVASQLILEPELMIRKSCGHYLSKYIR